MLKPTFVTTANGEPLTANRGLKFAVDCENVKLNVPISCKMDGDTTTSTAKIASTTMTSSTGTTVSSSGSAPIIHAIVSPLMHGLKPPGKLHTTGSPADSSKAYKQVWENYSLISGLYAHTEEYKVALFLHCIRTEGLIIYDGFQFETEADRKNLNKVLDKFNEELLTPA